MPRKEESSAKREDWIRVQPLIFQLYAVDGRPLHQVQKILETEHNFRATQRMYKGRVQAWKYDKYFKENEWRQIIALWKKRRDEQGKDTVFKVGGRTINSAKIRKFFKRKRVDESTFLDQQSEQEAPLTDIKISTPPGSPDPDGEDDIGILSEPSRQNSVSWVGMVPRTDCQTTGFGPPSEASGSSRRLVYGVEGMAMRLLTPDSVKLDRHDEEVLIGLVHATVPASLEDEPSPDSITTPSGPPPPTRSFAVKVDNAEIISVRPDAQALACQNRYIDSESRQASTWLALLFRACIFQKQGRQGLYDKCEDDAAKIFQHMVDSHNRFLLPGLGVLAGLMTAQHQWDVVGQFLIRCCQITAARRGIDDPFNIAFEHMYSCVARDSAVLPRKELAPERLGNAMRSFQLAWGKDHPNSIVLRCHYARELLIDGHREQAECSFRDLLPSATQVMGPSNYVTTGIMRLLSRACGDRGNYAEAITLMSDALERLILSLGESHPERMEGYRYLGVLYESTGDLEKAVEALHKALYGQVKLLGANHGLTIGAFEDLSRVLLRAGRDKEHDGIRAWIDEELERERLNSHPTLHGMSEAFQYSSPTAKRATSLPPTHSPSDREQDGELQNIAVLGGAVILTDSNLNGTRGTVTDRFQNQTQQLDGVNDSNPTSPASCPVTPDTTVCEADPSGDVNESYFTSQPMTRRNSEEPAKECIVTAPDGHEEVSGRLTDVRPTGPIS